MREERELAREALDDDRFERREEHDVSLDRGERDDKRDEVERHWNLPFGTPRTVALCD